MSILFFLIIIFFFLKCLYIYGDVVLVFSCSNVHVEKYKLYLGKKLVLHEYLFYYFKLSKCQLCKFILNNFYPEIVLFPTMKSS